MAEDKSAYARKAVLDHLCGRHAYAFPTHIYLACFTADPKLGLGSELSQLGYARVDIISKLSDADLSTGVITNSALIQFATAGEDWPEVPYFGLMDGATLGAGNLIYRIVAVTSRVIETGDALKLQPGQLTIQEE